MFTPEPQIIHYGGQTTKKTASKFQRQLFGSVLIYVKKHYSYPTFIAYRLLSSVFFFLRAPYWFVVAIIQKKERENAFQVFRSYMLSGFYAITDWTNLVMNKDIIKAKLR
jgi:GT2 family glycosyltransferase